MPSSPDPSIPAAPSRFASLAEAYCRLIDEREQRTGDQLLHAAYGLISQLCAAVLALPVTDFEMHDDADGEDAAPEDEEEDEWDEEHEPYDIEAASAETRKDRIPNERWWEVFRSLGKLFGAKDAYAEIFDPYGADPSEELVTATLADDLTDIYADLAEGLAKWRRGEHAHAATTWRVNFVIHWGEHATGALRALYALARDGKPPFPRLGA